LSQHRDGLTRLAHARFRDGFSAAAVGALEALDGEGLFGPRDGRVLLFHVSDSDQDAGAIRRLNSPALIGRWQAWS
jgi:hypothetical protein